MRNRIKGAEVIYPVYTFHALIKRDGSTQTELICLEYEKPDIDALSGLQEAALYNGRWGILISRDAKHVMTWDGKFHVYPVGAIDSFKAIDLRISGNHLIDVRYCNGVELDKFPLGDAIDMLCSLEDCYDCNNVRDLKGVREVDSTLLEGRASA